MALTTVTNYEQARSAGLEYTLIVKPTPPLQAMNPPTSIAAQAVAKHADPAVAAAVLQEALSQLTNAKQDSWLSLYHMALTALIADLYGTPLPSKSVLAEIYPALQPAAPTTTEQP